MLVYFLKEACFLQINQCTLGSKVSLISAACDQSLILFIVNILLYIGNFHKPVHLGLLYTHFPTCLRNLHKLHHVKISMSLCPLPMLVSLPPAV